jgi:hypothetical protein
MVYSGLLRRVALVITDVSEEPGASFIRVTKIGELGTTVLTRDTRRNNPEDIILHSHRRENLKSYIMKHNVHIKASESFSTAYLINLSSQYVTTCIPLTVVRKILDKLHLFFVARQRLRKLILAARNINDHRRTYGLLCLWICRRILLESLGNNWVNTF